MAPPWTAASSLLWCCGASSPATACHNLDQTRKGLTVFILNPGRRNVLPDHEWPQWCKATLPIQLTDIIINSFLYPGFSARLFVPGISNVFSSSNSLPLSYINQSCNPCCLCTTESECAPGEEWGKSQQELNFSATVYSTVACSYWNLIRGFVWLPR